MLGVKETKGDKAE